MQGKNFLQDCIAVAAALSSPDIFALNITSFLFIFLGDDLLTLAVANTLINNFFFF